MSKKIKIPEEDMTPEQKSEKKLNSKMIKRICFAIIVIIIAIIVFIIFFKSTPESVGDKGDGTLNGPSEIKPYPEGDN